MIGACPSCAVDYPARWAAYTPSAPAIVAGGERWTWCDLDRRVARTALWLTRDLGLRRGDRVALLALNDPRTFELLFACLRTGLVLAPLNYRLAARELDQLLALAAPGVMLVDREHRALAGSLGFAREGRVLGLELLGPVTEPVNDSPSSAPSDLEDPALILFTSGTTGLPKGALLPVRQLLVNATQTQTVFGLTAHDSTVLYTPLFHTGAINVLALPLLQCGGRVHIHRDFDVDRIWACVHEERITTIFGVPTTFELLADHAAFARAAGGELRLCLCGGAPLSVGLIQRYRDAGLTLTQGFGMTEVGPNCFYLPPHQALAKAGSVGLPMPWSRARVVRSDGTEARFDEVGELWLAGPHVSLGYFRNREATESAFAGEWFRTGDLARRDGEGFFAIAGRAKEMFISGGENVYPAEVEMVLDAHPEIVESAVVPMPDARWGEVGCAFVVTRSGRLDTEALRRQLRSELAGYKVPKVFCVVASLPRNPSGKILKHQLTQEAKRHAA